MRTLAKELLWFLVVMLTTILVGCAEPQMTFFGQGVERDDKFVGRYVQSLDILFVIDNSGSMAEEISIVKTELSNFLQTLNSRRLVDYQIAVTSTDARTQAGNLVASSSGLDLIQATTANSISIFSSMLDSIPNYSTRNEEMGFLSAELAIANHRNRFMRSRTPLAVIIITDEDDVSRSCDENGNCSLISANDYLDYFRSLRDANGAEVLLFPVIGKPPQKACNEIGSVGFRYQSVVDGFQSGATQSICNSQMPSSLQAIADTLSQKGDCYLLSAHPLDDSLSVSVNGKVIPASASNGYTYDAATRALCFAGSYLPGENAKISAKYLGK